MYLFTIYILTYFWDALSLEYLFLGCIQYLFTYLPIPGLLSFFFFLLISFFILFLGSLFSY
jgi:hypothetical protein